MANNIGTALSLAFGNLRKLTSYTKALTQNKFGLPIILLAAIAIAGRLWVASHFPLVNDEQFYIYDAILYNPQDPQFWKTPFFITALAGWIRVVGVDSLIAVRLFVIIACVLGLGILSYTAYRLAGRFAGWGTLLIAFFLPVVVSYTSIATTEQFMLLPLLAAVLLTIVWRDMETFPWWKLVFISSLILLATAVRWSSLLWFVAIAMLLRKTSLKEFGRRIIWLIIPFLVGMVAFLILFPDVLPNFQVGGIFIDFFEQSRKQGWDKKLLSWRAPLLPFSPLMVLGLLAWSGTTLTRKLIHASLVLIFLVLFFPAWKELIVSADYPFSPNLFFALLALVTALGIFLPTSYKNKTLIDALAFLIPPLIAYTIFNKVNPKYLTEFVPGLVLFAGLGVGLSVAAFYSQRKLVPILVLSIFIAWLSPWIMYPLNYPYAGTISIAALSKAVVYFRENVEGRERILTASSLIPLMAGKEPAFPLSHPAWIKPTFRDKPDPRYNAIYDPIATEIEKGSVKWFLDEKLTTDTYRANPRINAAIESLYEQVFTIENKGTRPLVIYRLK